QEFVEYDVSKLISGVTIRDKKKVGILSSLEVMGPEMSPYMMQMMQMQGKQMPKSWTVITHLKEKFELQNIKMDDVNAIDDDIDYLLVVHPKNLSEKTLFAIDQFVMKGGRLIVFTDPHCISDQPKQDPQNPYAAMNHDTSSSLDALLEKWGVKMADKQVVVDPRLALATPTQQNRNPEPFLPFIQLKPECFNADEVITSTLQDVRTVFAGSLEKTSVQGVKLIPLVTASIDGGTWQISNKWELQRPDGSKILKEMIRSGKETMLAALITGKLQSNFPDGIAVEDESSSADKDEENKDDKDKKAEDKKSTKQLTAVKEAAKDAMVVVVSDVDLISDMLAYQSSFFGMAQAGDNVNLLFNALDFMSGSTDLISIRSRGNINREFTAVKEIERDADQATAAEAEVINNKIAGYRQKLNKLGGSANEDNQKLIENKAVEERRKIEEEIRKANKALRDLQAGKREKVEALGNYYKFVNTVVTSAIVLMIAILLSIHRVVRARRYAARRTR
ncbi:MAG: Gldg family protein, partial [Planctomycetota bacterium]